MLQKQQQSRLGNRRNNRERYRLLWLPLCLLLSLLWTTAAPAKPGSQQKPTAPRFSATALRTEYLVNPLGLEEKKPRLSWQVQDSRRNSIQTAYQVLVASTPEKLKANQGDLWDSRKNLSNQSNHIVYEGPELQARQRYYWKVRVWDKQGKPSAWSEANWWEMGLLQPTDWQATWISLPGHEAGGPSPFFRKIFTPKGPIARARIYASARGLHQVHLNGQRVSNDEFRPGWTNYYVRFPYQTYDVTRLLTAGENVVGGIIGDGWYCGSTGFFYGDLSNKRLWGDYPSLLVQLEIQYTDGRTETIASDASWKTAPGPIRHSDMFDGETYDARLEMPGWNRPGFNENRWVAVRVDPIGDKKLEAYNGPPVRKIQDLQPKRLWRRQDGKFIVDMGQNMVGYVRLKVNGSPGTTVTLRHAEVLDKDSSLYTLNLRTAQATDHYILKGGGPEVYEPTFTFHGFRYVEVSGLPQLALSDLTGIVIHSDTPPVGEFETSNPLLNQLQQNIVWGQKSNFLEVPTDCPQRDERIGWLGDAQVFIKTATYNMDVAAFFTKWLADVRSSQLEDGGFREITPAYKPDEPKWVGRWPGIPGWGDCGVICPWTLYERYGDKRILEESYPSMTAWIGHYQKRSPNLIHPNSGFGDWLSVLNADTPKDLLGTAFFAYSTQLVGQVATTLGKEEDAKKYQALFEDIKKAFNREFVTETGRLFGNTQTSYLLALKFGLLPEEKWAQAAQWLVADIREKKNHLSTGFIGVSYLLPVLTENGYHDLAYQLLLNETFPSWGFTIKNGATTIWERWDGWTPEKGFQDPAMNSFNHYSFGSVGEWMYANIGGIEADPAAPGYKKIIIQPRPGGGLTFARSSLESPYGLISSDWKMEQGTFAITVTIPANTTATVRLPTADAERVTEGKRRLRQSPDVRQVSVQRDGFVQFEIGSGTYTFRSPLPVEEKEKVGMK